MEKNFSIKGSPSADNVSSTATINSKMEVEINSANDTRDVNSDKCLKSEGQGITANDDEDNQKSPTIIGKFERKSGRR